MNKLEEFSLPRPDSDMIGSEPPPAVFPVFPVFPVVPVVPVVPDSRLHCCTYAARCQRSTFHAAGADLAGLQPWTAVSHGDEMIMDVLFHTR